MASKSVPRPGGQRVASVLVLLLNAGFYLLAAVLVFVLCLAAASPFISLPAGGELGVPVSFSIAATRPITAPSLGVEAARITNAKATLVFDPPPEVVLMPLLGLAAMVAVAMWLIAELRAVVRTVRDGQPFAPRNAVRIRRVAWIVTLAQPAVALAVFSANVFVAEHFESEGLHFHPRLTIDPTFVIPGMIILVIAEVFRAGTRLDEDQSLTI